MNHLKYIYTTYMPHTIIHTTYMPHTIIAHNTAHLRHRVTIMWYICSIYDMTNIHTYPRTDPSHNTTHLHHYQHATRAHCISIIWHLHHITHMIRICKEMALRPAEPCSFRWTLWGCYSHPKNGC